MFDLNSFKQKSPQQRFLFFLRLAILFVYLGAGVFIIFFNKTLHIDPEKLPDVYRIAFGSILIVYGLIRFGRLLYKNETE